MTPSDSQGQRRERGPEAHDADPTGIRDLLASLPDPGPMPEHLVERIGARLAVEQAHRDHGSPGGLAARSDSVIDLAAERSHRRPGRTVALLGAAAAGLLVATVAIGELSGVGPGGGPVFDSAAQVPARGNGSGADSGGAAAEADRGDDAGGGAEAADEGQDLSAGGAQSEGLDAAAGTEDSQEGAGSGADGGDLPEAFISDVVVLPELGVVSPANFHDRVVQQAVDSAPETVAGSLTEAGARSCWQLVDPSEPWPTLRAAQAEMDGDRVVVLLGMRDASSGEALVLPWGCTAGQDVEPLDAVAWTP